MTRIAAMAAVAALCAAPLAFAADQEIVTLTVQEEYGFDRVNEPMTMGVPLPEGKVSDAGLLVLRDASGKLVPCQFTEAARWLDGRSVKWVHATWLQSLAAKGRTTVTVALNGKPAGGAATSLSAELKDNVVTVQTGYVKFRVRGAKFNGLDGAWFDPTGQNKFEDAGKIIEPGNTGGSKVLSPDHANVKVEDLKFKVEGSPTSYSSLNDVDGKVVIEEQGPRRVVVKATGRHFDEKGNKALDYIIRFYAYADSPIVRVSHTFVCAQGKEAKDLVFMSGLTLTIPTTLAGGKATFGTEKNPLAAPVGGRILQATSDSFTIKAGELELGAGPGKSAKPLTTGWTDLSKEELGLAVGVKWFWQMCPKGLSVAAGNVISVELYPSDPGIQPLEVYMGQSRTHYMTLVFHDDKTTAKDLNAIFAAQNRPLFAWASPKYYCRDTHAFGYAVENDPKLFGEDFAKVAKHDEALFSSLQQGIRAIDLRRGVADSYGIYAWGDLYHWQWKNNDGSWSWGKSPFRTVNWQRSWEGNYYDYPHVMFQGFVRTGEKLFLERFIPNAIQIGDVHTANYHPNPALIGACRYCPPRNFAATDDGAPYISSEYNHFKTQSTFAYYYLTGDLRVREQCMMLANNALTNTAADRGWAARGVGAQLGGLWNAYGLTRDPKYLARMKGMADRAMAQFRGGRYSVGGDFMWGIANEGLCYYYWVTGDPAVIETFKAGFPKCRAATAHPNMALGLAMTWRVTGDATFRDMAWKALSREKADIGPHGIGQTFRSSHFALFFLSEASKDWKPFTQP